MKEIKEKFRITTEQTISDGVAGPKEYHLEKLIPESINVFGGSTTIVPAFYSRQLTLNQEEFESLLKIIHQFLINKLN